MRKMKRKFDLYFMIDEDEASPHVSDYIYLGLPLIAGVASFAYVILT